MSTPTNELDTLLMESLQQLSAEFQQRETRLTEQQKSCIDSFTEQVEHAHAAARRNHEAIGRTDAALQGHSGSHAESREAVERFERKAQMKVRSRGLGR
jgi:hypothetical protein